MNKLIVALDVPDEGQALRLVAELGGLVQLYKVGLQLFTAAGPRLVRTIQDRGGEVFLDLKFLDIPNTVSHAALEGARLGARMMTFHALGGATMLRKARETLEEQGAREGWEMPTMLGVTILTSMDQAALASIGIDRPLASMVAHLAGVVREAGLPGIVCSPQELPLLHSSGFDDLLFVTPGVRPVNSANDDQARAATPGQAIRNGASYLVVGRPITQAVSPRIAAQEMIREIEQAERERT